MALLALTGLAVCEAGALPAGTLLVADSGSGGEGAVFAVDPATGARTVISQGGLLSDPFAVGIESNGRLLVVDEMGLGGPGRVVRLHPTTGAQTLVSSGGVLVAPTDLVVGPGGDIFVVDLGELFADDSFIARIDPVTGTQTVVYSDPAFIGDANRLGIDHQGRLLVSGGRDMAGIVRLDLATGTPEVIVPRPGGVIPPYFLDTVVDRHGTLFISGGDSADLFRVDLAAGVLETVFDGDPDFLDTRGLVVEADGSLVFSSTRSGSVFRVDPATGIASELSSGFSVPLGLALVPEPSGLGLLVSLWALRRAGSRRTRRESRTP